MLESLLRKLSTKGETVSHERTNAYTGGTGGDVASREPKLGYRKQSLQNANESD